MKWHHKAVYSLANAVLPTAVKRQMIGVGRATVPSNANPKGIFNCLSKKHQQAHNIDLTKLQSFTTEELLELFISVHPDVSYALHTYLRMGDTNLTFTAKKPNGNADKSEQRVLDELKAYAEYTVTVY
ncbi:hypothetical protein [Paenibacillus sp. JJ1722]|uniref:hypothetical protein n=1 Tax=Paenibacillus sp. JJ1722 TaxID=3398770 RepID=UPI003AB03C7D